MTPETIQIDMKDAIVEVRLCRPKVHNAFDATMVREVTEVFRDLAGDGSVRCAIITGEGKSFCAGVDLQWLGGGREAPYEKHLEETLAISAMFRSIYDLDKPVIAAVNGAALGGGVGFPAVADIVYAASSAVFGLSEVKIGVVPACISPFLLMRSAHRARLKELFISGERFTAEEACAAGVADHVVEPGSLLETARCKAIALKKNAPLAQGVCKRLFREVPGMPLDEAVEHTAKVLAELKTGAEARKGIAAFFDKKPVDWD